MEAQSAEMLSLQLLNVPLLVSCDRHARLRTA